ncbi:hypothetical protein Poli38472_003745 [Pythium oligandrum]|uniref:Uncharacterized protein n=1 Tax=Pythium oligandrum TaxID=41045 RepID=A0A8K1CMF1_PYTOL|nr:hypothetical protein Poli38472_003745 [Pythium oligandrum]|eukprot:TMW65980.1 hypothetical protein Poli38472_003745 [Pythium oligandrum]
MKKGAHMILACRNEARGVTAVQTIKEAVGEVQGAGQAEFMQVDVSDLSSVRLFAEGYRKAHDRLDILVNNAGIMAVGYQESKDGFESQFATNHLGHFALISHLLDLLRTSEDARIVCITSLSHRNAKLTLNQLVWPQDKQYDQQLVYANTKLYNLLFALELDRRLKANGITNIKVSASHPGFTVTNFLNSTLNASGVLFRAFFHTVSTIAQKPEMGILPILYAATAPGVPGGELYGPKGFHNMWGYPTIEKPQNASVTEDVARAIWTQSEQLAGIRFAI